jgi:hypothetical protein
VGKSIGKLPDNACIVETVISWSIAGLVEPTGKLKTTGKVIFEKEAMRRILDIDLTHGLGLVKPQLTLSSTDGTLTQLEEVT